MSKINNYVKTEKGVINLEYELVCNLIKLRKEKGLTQKKLAELADVDQPSVARIESGKHVPSLKMLIKFLTVMGYKIKFVKEK